MGQGSLVLRHALRQDRRALVVASLLVAGHQLCEAAVPVVVGAVLDLALRDLDSRALLRGAVTVTTVFVVLAGSAWAGYWLALRQERGAALALRVAVAARVLDPRGGAPGLPGAHVALAGGDADRAALVCRAVASGAGAGAALTGAAVVLLQASVLLGTVVLARVPAVLLGARLLSRPLAARAEAEQGALGETATTVTRLLGGLRALKGIGAERAAADAYRVVSGRALTARLRTSRAVASYEAATGLLSALLLASVALVGGDLAARDRISAGELVAALGLAQFLLGPLDRLVRVGALVQTARGSADRLAPLLSAPPAVVAGGGKDALPAGPGALRLRLGPVVVEVAAGEHVGLVVPDPLVAGTLLDVLARDRDEPGAVLLDGRDLSGLELAGVRRRLRISRHDATLVEDTVEQVTGEDPDVLAAARAGEVLATLSGGGRTSLRDGGLRLSGGQRQRLVLARALAGHPPVLVLHEPTTAVDAATEDAIADGVRCLREGRTTVVLTASPALLSRCDRVLLVDGVHVVQGRHDRLVADARYREVVTA